MTGLPGKGDAGDLSFPVVTVPSRSGIDDTPHLAVRKVAL